MRIVIALVQVILLAVGASAAFGQATKTFTPAEVVNPTAFYPEGPQLIPEGLLVSEMAKDRIVLLGKGSPEVKWSAAGCGPTSIKQVPDGGYWILCHLGAAVLHVDSAFHTIHAYTYSSSGKRITWPNDASVDAKGNIYLSSSGPYSLAAPAQGRVVYIPIDGNDAQDLVTGIRYSNGVLVQESRSRVLVSEMLNRRMLSYPLLAPGKLGPAKVFFEFKNAPALEHPYDLSGPDGIAQFKDGDILVADYGNGRVLLISDQGKFLQQIPVQYKFVTNMAITPDQETVYFTMTELNTSADLHGIVQKYSVKSKNRK